MEIIVQKASLQLSKLAFFLGIFLPFPINPYEFLSLICGYQQYIFHLSTSINSSSSFAISVILLSILFYGCSAVEVSNIFTKEVNVIGIIQILFYAFFF